MGLIDSALIANATIANGYDADRGKPPAPKIAIVTCANSGLSTVERGVRDEPGMSVGGPWQPS